MTEKIEQVQTLHEPVIVQDGMLELRLPEDTRTLLKVDDVYSPVYGLVNALCGLTPDEIIDRQRQSQKQNLSAVPETGAPVQQGGHIGAHAAYCIQRNLA